MDLLGQSALLVGMTSFALGFSVLARNVRNKLFLSYAVLTTLISAWALMFTIDKIWPGNGFYRWHLLFNIWLAPGSLVFIGVLVRIQDRIARRLLDLTLVSAMALTIALAVGFDGLAWVRQCIYFLPVSIVLLIVRMMWIDRTLQRGALRLPKMPTVGFHRRNLIYFGGLLVLLTSVMDHVPWMGTLIPTIGNILLTIYLFFITQAITQQRLLNFEALVSRFLVLLMVALTLTGVYSLLVGWIQNSPPLFFLNSFIASFLILMLLDPLRALVRYFTQRLLTQKYRVIDQTLQNAQRELVGITDLGLLFQSVLQTSEQILQPDWAALFVLRSDGTRFRRTRTVGESQQGLKELIADHPLIEYCRALQSKGQLPVLLDQIIENEIDRSASRTQREHFGALIQGLKALGCNLLIPMIDSDKVLGFVALHVPGPPEPWGNNWGILPIVYPYFEQAALTMRSMEIFVRQREKARLAVLGEMSAGLAHEIRNPLGAIKGAAQFLDPSIDRPESKFLKVIIEEVDRLNGVVTQFLDYSKTPTSDLKPVDLSELAKKTVETALPSLNPAQIKLEFAPSSKRAIVQAAPEQIQQVLLNLIQNSVNALEGRTDGKITVSVQVDEDTPSGPGGEVFAAVQDNGKGIKKEHLDKLFIPFFTTSPKGTGLGLSISQKIIEAHRGRIEVNSEEGRFTRFSVVLPKAKE
jgi:two-component system sensor histidine kinase HydH